MIGEEDKPEVKKVTGAADSDSDIEDMSEESGKDERMSDKEMNEGSEEPDSESSEDELDGHDAL